MITVDDAMTEFNIGPNAGLIYCIDFLYKNITWLISKINENKSSYLVFDLPGMQL